MRRLPWEGFAVWGVVRRDRQWKAIICFHDKGEFAKIRRCRGLGRCVGDCSENKNQIIVFFGGWWVELARSHRAAHAVARACAQLNSCFARETCLEAQWSLKKLAPLNMFHGL